MASIRSSKAVLRKAVAEQLAKLSTEDKVRQSKIVQEKLFKNPIFQNSKRISIFLSIENEINTEPIVRKIFELEKQCFIPRYSKTAMQMVKLQSMEDWSNLPVTNWKIKQPNLKENREVAEETGGLDLIIVPGVAFSKEGARLGHGGGYYDKYLRKLIDSQELPPKTIGIAFKEQLVEEIPVEDSDILIDLILYDQ